MTGQADPATKFWTQFHLVWGNAKGGQYDKKAWLQLQADAQELLTPLSPQEPATLDSRLSTNELGEARPSGGTPPVVGYRAPITSAPYCLDCIARHKPWDSALRTPPVSDTHESCIQCGKSLRAEGPSGGTPEPEKEAK